MASGFAMNYPLGEQRVRANMNLRDVYRANDVFRWQIVKTARRQSVAEHSFAVAMIGARICALMGRADLRDVVVWRALCHDLPEVLTGDMATPLKELIGKEARGRLAEFEHNISILDGGYSRTSLVVAIVKAADLVEAAKFLHENNTNSHGRGVLSRIQERIEHLPDELIRAAAAQAYEEILYDEETTLDDLILPLNYEPLSLQLQLDLS